MYPLAQKRCAKLEVCSKDVDCFLMIIFSSIFSVELSLLFNRSCMQVVVVVVGCFEGVILFFVSAVVIVNSLR